MKSLMKKITALIAAVVTMLGIAGLGVSTAVAADDGGQITVNTARKFAGELKLYQMFTATVDGADKTNVTYTLTDSWKEFFTSAEDAAAGTKLDANAADLSEKAAKHIQGLNETDLAAFANKAQAWAEAKKIAATQESKDATGKTATTFTQLALGYYLVAPAAGQKDNTVDGQYHALLVNLTDITNDVSIQLKHEFPIVDKTVDDKNAEDKNIGDTVNYKLSSTAAGDMADYTAGYVFTFHDSLSAGLTLNLDTTDAQKPVFKPVVKIYADAADTTGTVVPEANYKATASTGTDGKTTITVEMLDIQHWGDANAKLAAAGKTITVEYSATLNEKAKTGTEGNTNSAQIEYSNDPTNNQTGWSVPDEVKVHTFGFMIDKFTSKNENSYNESSERLGGAKFKVYAADKTTVLKFNLTNAGDGSNPATAVYAEDQTATGLAEELATPKYGRIKLSGLKAGTYYVQETAAPEGYNKLANMLKVTIEANYDQNTGKLSSWNIKYAEDANNATESTGKGENPVLPVWNSNKGDHPVLPSTGGMGTALFTVFGVLIVALGAGWYVRSRRRA